VKIKPPWKQIGGHYELA